MNNFNIKRFGHYALSTTTTNMPGYLRIALIFAGICTFGFLLCFALYPTNPTDLFPYVPSVLAVVLGIVWNIRLAASFKEYHKAHSAPRIMMLPVSKIEKYLTIILTNGIIYPLILIIPMLICTSIASIFYTGGDLLVAVRDNLYNDGEFFGFGANFTGVLSGKVVDMPAVATLFVSWVSTISYYLLVGVIFRRAQYLIAIGIIILYSIFWAIVGIVIVQHSFYTDGQLEEFIVMMLNHRIYFDLALGGLFLVLTWRRFRKLRVRR